MVRLSYHNTLNKNLNMMSEESILKPLYASLKRLEIGTYLYSKEFEYFALESRIDDLWKDCKKEAYSKRKVVMFGHHNTEDDDQAFMYLMSIWYNMRPDSFAEFILSVLQNFAEWSPVKLNYNLVILRLQEINIDAQELNAFIAIYETTQTHKPIENAELKISRVVAESGNNNVTKSAMLLPDSTNTKMKRIFVSHSSKDVKYVEELIDLLKLIGLQKNQIFCTSVRGYGIPLGANFLSELKDQISDEVLVLFLFSSNFYASPICLAELGATWVLSNEHVPIVIPPFGFGDIKGVLPHTQGMVINDSLQINELAQKIETLFGLKSYAANDDWERSRERIIERIDRSIAQDAAVRTAANTQGSVESPKHGFN
jgi:hypothetical protein